MTYKITNSGTILVILEYDNPMINPARRVNGVSIDLGIDRQAASNNICGRMTRDNTRPIGIGSDNGTHRKQGIR